MIYSYACKVLNDKNLQIYLANHQKIFTAEHNVSYPPLKTELSKDFTEVKEIIELDDYYEKIENYSDFISRFNFKILKLPAYGKKYKHQRVLYKIVHSRVPDAREINKFSQNHHIVVDWYNKRMRGVGKFFESGFPGQKGNWIPWSQQPPQQNNQVEFTPNLDAMYQKYTRRLNKLMPDQGGERKIIIPEIVLGISQEGYIVTLPEPDPNNPYFITINGAQGTGKSLLQHNLGDGYYHKWKIASANINDIKFETWTRCRPWKQRHWMCSDLHRFGEQTMPLPAVYLYPTTKRDYEKYYENEIGFEVSLPFNQLIKDEKLLQTNDAWNMNEGGAQLTWKNLIWDGNNLLHNGLYFKKDLTEIRNYINNKVKNSSTKGKILRVVNDLASSNLSDISSYACSRWILRHPNNEMEADSPWNIALKAGLKPYVVTKAIRGELWYPLWLRFIIFDIMRFADKEKMPIQIEMDEIAPIMKNKDTREIVEDAIRECRSSGVGITLVSHYDSDVPESIQMHEHYRFVFKTGDTKLMKKLKPRLGKKANSIARLKPFQCYAFGRFKLYDTDGRSWIEDEKPIKIIRVKPSNSRHYGGIQNG